ncbi:hypothetical protein WCT67_17825, partial [Pectobacterium parvum]|uniref:hypothetical protein n=1 Tax=Pectobacterium parvum TaxID=2778550 RepID=UPI0030174DCE
YFKLHVRWLRSLTRITYLSKLIGIPSLATFLKLELFRVDCFKNKRYECYLFSAPTITVFVAVFMPQ